MANVIVGVGSSRTISQSETDTVAFLGAGTLNIAGTSTSPIDVTLSSVSGIGLLDTINITSARVSIGGLAGIGVLNTYNIGDGGTLALTSGVQLSAGSTINFTSPNAHLIIENGATISALTGISGYQAGDTIDLPSVAASVTYQDNPGANTGGLLIALDANGNTIASIGLLTGDYTGQSFGMTPGTGGGSTIGIPGTAAGTGTNGTGAAAATAAVPLYRFFDSKTGTQFLTASAAEKAALSDRTLPSYRPDLVGETNSFGAVDPSANDPAKIQVFRFFDTRFGTHFFTSSQTEAAGLADRTSATYRSDLIAEPAATFYEHSTQQAGDVGVYRLFDSTHGTHFYTGSTTELAGLTTPGAGTYRPDLVNEGISFYAPSGSFT